MSNTITKTEATNPEMPQLATSEALGSLTMLVSHQLKLEDEIAELQERITDLNKKLIKVAQEDIPAEMTSLGLTSLELEDGSKLSLKDFYSAHISKDNQRAAFKWLREHDRDSLIKSEVSSSFGKGHDTEKSKLEALLRKHKISFTAKESVHAQTLKSFVKEAIEAGEDLPMDLFGVFVGKKSIIKR